MYETGFLFERRFLLLFYTLPLFPTQTLAEIPMFDGSDYPAYAATLEDSRLCFVERNGLQSLFARDPGLALKMLAGLSKRLRALASQLEVVTAHDVRRRLLQYIVSEHNRKPHAVSVTHIRLPITKSVLAATLGMSLETLSRTFRKLEDEGLIKVKGKLLLFDDIRYLHQALR